MHMICVTELWIISKQIKFNRTGCDIAYGHASHALLLHYMNEQDEGRLMC
jgi:hypothetical protein